MIRTSGILLLGSLLAVLSNVSAYAVELGQQGLGQVLIYPYYNIRNGNTTLLSVTNTTQDAKAIKVIVRESDNGHSVLSVNLYLGANDVWTASLSERMALDGSMVPILITQDSSCTVPADLSNDGVNIQPDAPGILSADPFIATPDMGRQSEDRLREGYVQIIEMGTLSPDIAGFTIHDLFDAAPNNCPFFVDAWEDTVDEQGIFRLDPQSDMLPPTGGLFGDGLIVNVPGARAAAFEAVALNDFYAPVSGLNEPSLHTAPESSGDGLAAATPPLSRVLLDTDEGMQIIEDTWDNGLQAVDAVLMTDQVISQYAAEAFISGATEWVLTFPGRQAHVSQVDAPIPPYTSLFAQTQADGPDCELAQRMVFDRNQRRRVFSGGGFPLDPPQPIELCYEVNVVTFNSRSDDQGSSTANELTNTVSDLLSSRVFVDIPVIVFETGHAMLQFNGQRVLEEGGMHELVNPQSNRVYRGIPVVGFGVRGAENRGLNALFGTGFQHNYQRVILSAE